MASCDHRTPAALFFGVISVPLFWYCRSAVYQGDGDQIARFIEAGVWFVKTEVLSQFLFQIIYRIVDVWHWDGLLVMNLISSISGGTLLYFFIRIGDEIADRWIAAIVLFCSGFVCLVAGHTEYYPQLLAALAAWNWSCIRVLRNRGSLLAPSLLYSLCVWIHQEALFAFPAHLLVAVFRKDRDEWVSWILGLIPTGFLMVFRFLPQISPITLEGMSHGLNTVPLWTTEGTEKLYTFFEAAHWVDVLFALAQRSIIAWPVILLGLLFVRSGDNVERGRIGVGQPPPTPPPDLIPSQKVGKPDFNPLLTSPDLRGRNISSSLPTNLEEDNDAIDAWSPPKIDAVAKSLGYGFQPPPNLPRSSGEEKEMSVSPAVSPPKIGGDTEGVDTSLPASRQLSATPSDLGEEIAGQEPLIAVGLTLMGRVRLFLAVQCAGLWVLCILWHPNLGIEADWDLYAVEAIPSTILALTYLPGLFERRFLFPVVVCLVCFSGLVTWEGILDRAKLGKRGTGTVQIEVDASEDLLVALDGHQKGRTIHRVQQGHHYLRLIDPRQRWARAYHLVVAPDTRLDVIVEPGTPVSAK